MRQDSKSRHLMMINNLRKKEDNWNARFNVPIKQESQERSKVKVNEKQKMLNKLTEVYNQFLIPEFHRQLFFMCLDTLPKPQNVIQFEMEEIINKKSHIQVNIFINAKNCMQAILSRENCVNELMNNINLISVNPNNNQLISKSAEYITHLRILSINVVELIVQWREYLMKYLINQHSHESIKIIYLHQNNENYLYKMKSDSQQIQCSVLRHYYEFSIKNDPFFLSITKQTDDNTKIVQYVSKILLKRAKVCEIILQDEQSNIKEERQKIVVKNERPLLSVGKIRPKKQYSKELSQNSQQDINQGNLQDLQISPIVDEKSKRAEKKKLSQPQNKIILQNSNQKATSEHHNEIKQDIKSKQNTIESKRQEPKIQSKEFRIIKSSLKDEVVLNYLKQIPEQYIKSHRGEIQYMNQLYMQHQECFCLGLYKEQLIGLSQIYYDNHQQGERKLIIGHFSVIDPETYKELLQKLLELLWANDSCLEIRIQLYHYQQGESYCANKDLTAIIKDVGFKWKIVQSVDSETRFTVFAIRRPADLRGIELYDPIYIQQVLYQNESRVQENKAILNQCLSFYQQTQDTGQENISSLTQKLIENGYQFNCFRYFTQTNDEFVDYLKQNFTQIDELLPQKQKLQSQIQMAIGKECYKWADCKLAVNEGLLYYQLNTNKEPSVFLDEKANTKLYLIRTDQSNIKVFIIEGDVRLEDANQIVQESQEQVELQKPLYIPQFIYKQQMQVNEKLGGIVKFSTHYKPTFADYNEFEQGYVIKTPFIFGILQDEYYEITNQASIMFQVTATDCIKY